MLEYMYAIFLYGKMWVVQHAVQPVCPVCM